ncbi:protein DEK-like isoform X3 [Hetaerina americana]|uniref:protein DEK-like isoform X3 n=1 Tax=Hetaerina americana TaxID=62018 RepID=UPI003A7F23C6
MPHVLAIKCTDIQSTKDAKDKSKEDGHLDNETPLKTEDSKDDCGKIKDKLTPSKKNAKSKSQKKEEKNEVDEDEEDDDEEEDEDDDDEEENGTNGKVPLLDQPLQISGTRDRKKVQRFSEEFKTVIRETPKNEIPEGRGVQLGEIPRIESVIQKHTSETLKPLYKVLFNRPGKLSLVKRNIRKFNGFDFKVGSDEYLKKRASVVKLDMRSLKSICSTLDLGSSGSREDLVDNVLTFLMEPKDKKKQPLKDSKKTKKVAAKSSPSSSKKTKRKSNSTARRKKKADSDDDEENESSEDEMELDDKDSSEDEKKNLSEKKNKSSGEKKDSSDEKKESSDEMKESSDEDEEDSDEKKKKKKAPKKKPVANAKKPAPKKIEPKKVETTKKVDAKTAEKKKRKEKESDVKSDGASSEDEPLVKKTKMPPTDEEIKCFVKQILEGANLEEITMKTVCKQVYAAYPEFDLAHKKDFIKTTVKSLIST